MNEKIAKVIERIDALGTREKIYLSFCVLVCFGGLADLVYISPVVSKQKEVQIKLKNQTADVMRLRTDSSPSSKPKSEAQSIADAIAEIDEKEKSIDSKISGATQANQSSTDIERFLVEILKKHDSLTLLGVSTPAQAEISESGITRKSIILKVSGPYSELTRYVKKLEESLPDLRWGALSVSREKESTEMTLQVDLLGKKQ